MHLMKGLGQECMRCVRILLWRLRKTLVIIIDLGNKEQINLIIKLK
ncbi:hypothetical protein CNEO4_540020 [Clostridium neonatale]|nr:hypothetical protein CNEO2_520021 [Clostridium neonatale]CAI3210628.1 hypothetical protein CNEO2_440020 [Clostridium neonatale]CAI3676501.1 hypothetical protein CNEO4_540020 [Clostridium neonatale]